MLRIHVKNETQLLVLDELEENESLGVSRKYQEKGVWQCTAVDSSWRGVLSNVRQCIHPGEGCSVMYGSVFILERGARFVGV